MDAGTDAAALAGLDELDAVGVDRRLGDPGSSGTAAWLRAVMELSSEAMLLVDDAGMVVDVNAAFTAILGYRRDDCPYAPPFPWWPREGEDAAALAALADQWSGSFLADGEWTLYRPDRTPVQVHARATAISNGTRARLLIWRDMTRDRQSGFRRMAAAAMTRSFTDLDDLGDIIAVAEHGFGLIFDGRCTLRVGAGEGRSWFSSTGFTDTASVPGGVAAGLAAGTSPDTLSLRPGILLLSPDDEVDCRAWVQFPHPRRIGLDEMIAADALAASLAAALRRLSITQAAADREANLRIALESHRLIGQATGILVERHRLCPAEAFELLRGASQDRNLKLRDLAARVIETGLDPGDA